MSVEEDNSISSMKSTDDESEKVEKVKTEEPVLPMDLDKTMPPPSMGPPTRGPTMGPPRKVAAAADSPKIQKSAQPSEVVDQKLRAQKIAEKKAKYMEILGSLKYSPPEAAASRPDTRYSFEILKGGTIVDSIKFSSLEEKGFYIVGRVPACDIVAENPTVSRMHAIFQFIKGDDKMEKNHLEDDGQEIPTNPGLYIYDLDSSHGTFINKNQIFPKRYYRLKVGHVLKFGNSARLYILNGPSEDEEEESEKTVTELQNEKLQKELERKKLQAMMSDGKDEVKKEDDGCGWGMADDAEEESDMRENPFAINFEASDSFDNPKKTLRSWFDREGFDLEYDCREKAPGQFVCRINLPIDGPGGQAVFAEVDHKGKKKEAVAQAALQACQILDQYGVLRQSNQESRTQLKKKNWEEQDYYSSDEDTFLDRTGSVEKKRQNRMKIAGKLEHKVETYESLCKQAEEIQMEITSLQTQLQKAQKMNSIQDDDVDLDDYVNNLKSGTIDVKKLKTKIREQTEELKRISKLRDIARPASLPSQLSLPVKTKIEIVKSGSTEKEERKSDTLVSPKTGESMHDTKPISTTSDSSSDKSTKDEKPPTEKPKLKLFGPRVVAAKYAVPDSSKSVAEASTMLVEEEDDDADSSEPIPRKVPRLSPPAVTAAQALDNESSSGNSEEDDDEDGERENEPKASNKRKKKPRYRQPRPKVKKDNTNFGAYDKSDPKYDVWVPPEDQRGDGRTSLNDKLGY